MGKSTPSAPNPYTTAAAQTSSNLSTAAQQQSYNVQDAQKTAQMNRVWQTSPTGTLSYDSNGNQIVGATPTGLSAIQNEQAQDAWLTRNTNLQPNAASTLSQPTLNTSVGYGGTDNLVSQESSDLQNSILQRLSPLEQQQTSSEQTELANQGITPGSVAYQNAMLGVQQQQNDLALGAVSTADQEQQQVYNQALQNATFGNDALQQMFQNQATAGQYADQQQYTVPIEAAAGLTQLGQAQMPTFGSVPQVSVNSPSVDGTNVSNDVYSSYNDQVQQAQAQNSALGSLLGTVGGAGLTLATGGAGLGALGTSLGLPGLFGLGSNVANGAQSTGASTLQSLGFYNPVGI